MNALSRLNCLVQDKGPLLAGLDPDYDKIKDLYNRMDRYETIPFIDYCENYIDAIKNIVAAIKINSAFFEAHRYEEVYFDIARIAKENGLFVIGDVKRADIGNTSMQYAEAYLGEKSPFDAITINPYFGTDGVKPFIEMASKNDKGIFVLVKTSNPSSSELQDQILGDGRRVYEMMADHVNEWGKNEIGNDSVYSCVGAVVGATSPEAAKVLRKRCPRTFFLVPGYGAQGATAEDIVWNFDNNNGGAIVNSSRGLMFAIERSPWNEMYGLNNWRRATMDAATCAQEELKKALKDSELTRKKQTK